MLGFVQRSRVGGLGDWDQLVDVMETLSIGVGSGFEVDRSSALKPIQDFQ